MMDTNKEKVSYCIGLEAGKNIKGQFKDIDHSLLIKGFGDALAEKAPALAKEEIVKILQALQNQVQEQQKVFLEQLAEKNKNDGEEFLKKNKRDEDVNTLPSGLQYKILQSGSGKSPSTHDEVTVHYRGTLINGNVFDSTYDREAPATFPVSRVIPGWTEALKKMRVGDKWQIFIPSYLAYGENGYGPYIEPNSTLIFDMELIKIN